MMKITKQLILALALISLIICSAKSNVPVEHPDEVEIIFKTIKRKEMKRVYYSKDDHHWLALNIYHEARGESLHGMMAVAFVTMNRVHHRRFPDTIKGVVQDPHQFSWYSDGVSDKPMNTSIWEDVQEVATLCLELYNTGADVDKGDDTPDWIVEDALFYYAPKKMAEPYWVAAENMIKTTEIGNHIFYKL